MTSIAIDPTSGCGSGTTAALGEYQVDVSIDGGVWQTAASGTFTEEDTWRLNALSLDSPHERVRFVRLIALSSQNEEPGFGGARHVTVTELEVYGEPSSPRVSVDDLEVTEGGAATFALSLSYPSPETVSIPFATQAGTAGTGADYVARSGTVTFAPGQTIRSIAVATVEDARDEPRETFSLRLGSPTNGRIGDGDATAAILDDDAPPRVTVGDVRLAEGHTGTRIARIPVRLAVTSGFTISVTYATANGTAIAGRDYVARQGTIVFPTGTRTRTITVAVQGDRRIELNETFRVRLLAAVKASFADRTGLVTIRDDD